MRVCDFTSALIESRKLGFLANTKDPFRDRIFRCELQSDITQTHLDSPERSDAGNRRQDFCIKPIVVVSAHTDRIYRATLICAGMRQTMIRSDGVNDIALNESCFGTIKTELEMADDVNEGARQEIADGTS
ncbi:hypothetical protein K2X85_15575 [bacterium]|nr:hypothetical protein [bacterium]